MTSFPKWAADVRVCTRDTEQDRRDEEAWATDVRQHEENAWMDCAPSAQLPFTCSSEQTYNYLMDFGPGQVILFLCIHVTIKEDQYSVRRHILTLLCSDLHCDLCFSACWGMFAIEITSKVQLKSTGLRGENDINHTISLNTQVLLRFSTRLPVPQRPPKDFSFSHNFDLFYNVHAV